MATTTDAARADAPAHPLDWLRGLPIAIPDVVTGAHVGHVAWAALLREHLTRIVWGELAIAVDRDETPTVRAAAALELVPRRAVVGRSAAVWVHAGGPPPPRIDVLVTPKARRPEPHPQRVPHECALPASDVVDVGPLRVTTIERTAVDVARWLPEAAAAPLLDRLRAGAGLDPERALRLLDSLVGYRGRAGASVALHSFAARSAQHVRDTDAADDCAADDCDPGVSPASPGSPRAQRPPATP